MTTLSQDHHPTLRHVDREAVGVELQSVLIVLSDLALTGKQAHWNVVGPHFRSLHLQLDEAIDAWRIAADQVAERAVALGHSPDARATTIAEQTRLPELPEGQILDRDLLTRLVDTLTEAIGTTRAACEHVEELDVVTADLLHAVLAKLEEQHWMLRVQTAA